MLKNKYSNYCLIIDKANGEYPDSLFLNSDHLNEKGANRFTGEVIEIMNQNRLSTFF